MNQESNPNKNSLFVLSGVTDDEPDLIPLLSSEDEEQINAEDLPETLPILPLRNTVLFPGVVIPITVGRDKSIRLIKDAYKSDKTIGVVSQKEGSIEDPSFKDIFKVGTVAYILKMLQMPDGNTTVIIQGKKRFQLKELTQEEPYFIGKVDSLMEQKPDTKNREFVALVDSLKDLSLQIIKQNPQLPSEAAFAIRNIESPSFLINFISSNLNAELMKKQELLEMNDLKARAGKVLELLTKELQMLELKNQIQSKVKVDIDKQQREYFLNQQLKTIQEELGGSTFDQEVAEMKEKSRKKKWSKAVAEIFDKEVERLQRINPAAAEYSVIMNYLDLLLELPWNEYSTDNFDLKHAEKILDKDHYGLERVKKRIMEYLAVLKLKQNMKSPIMCLYGPPGVGKTSLGKSIAEALGRKYVRMSLGGLRDEAEIRGHRKTYIGAMPGRIVQNIKKAKTSNPVFVLDEIDKLTFDHHGDPSSAMLEVLDPEQNNEFYDNFLEMGYDLSHVLFIATANSLGSIQPALRDRMEIIEISGYTLEEKVEIAKRHLIPKQIEAHGLKKKHVQIKPEILEIIVDQYTSESGVRGLEKMIASVVRNIAKSVAMEEKYSVKVSAEDIRRILGAPKFIKEKYLDNNVAGVVTGLAWTPHGGEILFIETSLNKGKGKLTLTGNLGDVMKESATIALAYLKAHALELNIDPRVFDRWDIHIHVPEGATPKDGPSAGIAMLTSLASAFTQRKVKLKIAMTGEITLRGKVLAVGGIKEKILAAKRSGINTIILSEDNRKDIEEISKNYLDGMNFVYVKEMIDVVNYSLTKRYVDNRIDFSIINDPEVRPIAQA
ncbi:MAG TPA: endopeptidase La [Bacteroidia bacterium]|nr:endopeptidase La [Bacteroidia bacterium]HNT80950.1 endopeptidase La [Bacteroidia bacterium]